MSSELNIESRDVNMSRELLNNAPLDVNMSRELNIESRDAYVS